MTYSEEPLTIDHKQAVTAGLNQKIFSEQAFSTLYLYRQIHGWTVIKNDRNILIGLIGTTYDGQRIFMPGNEKQLRQLLADQAFLDLLAALKACAIYPVQEITARTLSTIGFAISSNIDDSDYIMSRQTLESYPGRSLDGKRNAVHQFESAGTSSVARLDKANAPDAFAILDSWDQAHSPELYHEMAAARTGILDRDALHIIGWIAYLDNVPQAVCYGETLNQSTFLIHCAKAAAGSARGALPFLHQQIAQALPPSISYLNWEQDLGIMGLRKSKLAYMPASIMSKWRVNISHEHQS